MKQSIIATVIIAIFSFSTVAEAAKKGKGKVTTTPTASTSVTTPATSPIRMGSSKNEKHGDGGRAQAAADAQIAELEVKITSGMPRRERLQIEQKIKNIREAAARKAKGEEHGRRGR